MTDQNTYKNILTLGTVKPTTEQTILKLLAKEEEQMMMFGVWKEATEEKGTDQEIILRILRSFQLIDDTFMYNSTKSMIESVKNTLHLGLAADQTTVSLRLAFPIIVDIHEELAKAVMKNRGQMLDKSVQERAEIVGQDFFTWNVIGKVVKKTKNNWNKKRNFKPKSNNDYKTNKLNNKTYTETEEQKTTEKPIIKKNKLKKPSTLTNLSKRETNTSKKARQTEPFLESTEEGDRNTRGNEQNTTEKSNRNEITDAKGNETSTRNRTELEQLQNKTITKNQICNTTKNEKQNKREKGIKLAKQTLGRITTTRHNRKNKWKSGNFTHIPKTKTQQRFSLNHRFKKNKQIINSGKIRTYHTEKNKKILNFTRLDDKNRPIKRILPYSYGRTIKKIPSIPTQEKNPSIQKNAIWSKHSTIRVPKNNFLYCKDKYRKTPQHNNSGVLGRFPSFWKGERTSKPSNNKLTKNTRELQFKNKYKKIRTNTEKVTPIPRTKYWKKCIINKTKEKKSNRKIQIYNFKRKSNVEKLIPTSGNSSSLQSLLTRIKTTSKTNSSIHNGIFQWICTNKNPQKMAKKGKRNKTNSRYPKRNSKSNKRKTNHWKISRKRKT